MMTILMDKLHEYMRRRNKLYSNLLRDNITNGEIVGVHALLVALYVACHTIVSIFS